MEGVRVYVPDPEHVWLPGVITRSNADGTRLTVRLEPVVGPTGLLGTEMPTAEQHLAAVGGNEREVDLSDSKTVKALMARNISASSLPVPNSNAHRDSVDFRSLPLQNVLESVTGFEDMITIDHLHEASILHNLRRRFFQSLPYTYTGKICIAVNPYQWLNLYDKATMARFSDGRRDGKPPHVYAVSMDAFMSMRTKKRDQSILVSGESGAGKTETTKIVMSHLASLAENSNSKVIQQIIQSNPLLESFGNAKTKRNDNSSRFGKFTELQFSSDGKLIGAFSRTYLLEKSRVTTQADGERNFHIFYQLLNQAAQFPDLALSGRGDFRYVPSNEDQDFVMKEEGDLERTRDVLELIGIGNDLQMEILYILAGILHLGETDFCVRDGDVDASKIVDMKPFETACRLLGVKVEALEQAVCNRNVHVGREVILKPITHEQATDCRDALAKSLYSKLFLWLVEKINDTIGVKAKDAKSFIGILDIFGFEHFETNSFEQFCINYANEKLQQKFVQDVLKTVQLEYEEENISWSHIQFADNQDVLNLIEGRLGVISFLNEESLLATGTDEAFASKLGAVMQNNPLLETPRLNRCAFTIYHYAGKVTYDAHGFLDKHRDAILPDIKYCMSTSSLQILSKTFESDKLPSGGHHSLQRTSSRKMSLGPTRRTTVGTQFKESLSELMEKIGLTDVQYVRCLKPNGLKSAHAFSHSEIVNQLRCAGVIEAIKVSRSAYPSRITHVECVKKFRMLLDSAQLSTVGAVQANREFDPEWIKAQCELLVGKLLPGRNIKDYQVGLTRVYFREGVLEKLESKRAQQLRQFAVLLQKTIRCFLVRRKYLRIRRSAVVVQKNWRCHVTKQRYQKLRHGVIKCQAHIRGQLARKHFRELKHAYYIIRFQAICRAFIYKRRYLKLRSAVSKIQSIWRFILIRRVFLKKMEEHKKIQELGSKVALIQKKLETKPTKSPTPSGSPKERTSSSVDPTGSINGNRPSAASTATSNTSGIFGESHEVISLLHEENEKLRQQLSQREDEIEKLKTEVRTLREWQRTKEVDDKVQKLAHRDQESKDLSLFSTLENEYERLRVFLCDNLQLPTDTGSIATPVVVNANGAPVRSSAPPPSERELAKTAADAAARSGFSQQKVTEAQTFLIKSATRLNNARAKTSGKGVARRVKDHWEEIRNFPPPMHYTLGSVPWKRLLTDWAQGNPKKLDYMTRWLKNVLDGGPIVSDTFPMGVELKYVTPMMLDGFMQLVIPKLAERPDIQVHVHTKEFIGTSMRITLSTSDSKGPRGPPADEDFQRMSVLASRSSMISNNSFVGGSGRLSTTSTAPISEVSSSSANSSHRPSSFFRPNRGSESRGSLFYSRK